MLVFIYIYIDLLHMCIYILDYLFWLFLFSFFFYMWEMHTTFSSLNNPRFMFLSAPFFFFFNNSDFLVDKLFVVDKFDVVVDDMMDNFVL